MSEHEDRLANVLDRVATATENHGRSMDGQARWARLLFFSVVGLTAASAAGTGYQQHRQSIASDTLQALALEVRGARDEARGAREDARLAASEAAEAREEIQASQIRIEAPPASAKAKPGTAILRVPRPATSTSPAAPAASVPITIGGSSGAGP